jgi:hypothetical protein
MDDESLITLEYHQDNGSPVLATVEAGYHAPGKFREVIIAGTDCSAVCDYNVAQYKIKIVLRGALQDSCPIRGAF